MLHACASPESSRISAEMAGDALYRPVLHFTLEAHWMNDPNGLFFDGVDTYHLVLHDGSSLEYLGESGLVSLTDLYFVKQWFSHLKVDAQEGLSVHVKRQKQVGD